MNHTNIVTDNSAVISSLENRVKELEEVVNAVAHIGVDFGFGRYELEDSKIDDARKLMEDLL